MASSALWNEKLVSFQTMAVNEWTTKTNLFQLVYKVDCIKWVDTVIGNLNMVCSNQFEAYKVIFHITVYVCVDLKRLGSEVVVEFAPSSELLQPKQIESLS